MQSKFRLLLVAALAAALVLPANAVWAALLQWDADVTDVDDGDTYEADIVGDNTTDTPQIRMTGIQAMELTDYSNTVPKGACMAPEAALALTDLVEGKKVRLSAVKADSLGSRDRLQRYTSIYQDGKWRDVGRLMLRRGLVLWSSNGEEWVKNKSYYLAAKSARRNKLGIWDPTYAGGRCDPGPQPGAKLDMWIQWDADGPDGTNVNGEWARIRNRGSSPVDIGGWTFRDPSLTTAGVANEYTFPRTASIPARRSIQLKVGKGSNVDDRTYFWGQTKPKFENIDASRGIGDGGYLFDPDGSIRASFMYPCMPVKGCVRREPLRGKVKVVKANYDPDGDELKGEYIDVKNVSSRKVRLEKYQLEVWPFGYAFARTDVLKPNQVLRLWVKKGKDGRDRAGRLVRYWGHTGGPILNNSGDWARIKTFDAVEVHCLSWNKRCGATN